MKHTSTIYGDTHKWKMWVCFKVANSSFSSLSVLTTEMQLAMLAGIEHLPPGSHSGPSSQGYHCSVWPQLSPRDSSKARGHPPNKRLCQSPRALPTQDAIQASWVLGIALLPLLTHMFLVSQNRSLFGNKVTANIIS